MNDKKEKKVKTEKVEGSAEAAAVAAITNKTDLKNFLMGIRDKMSDDTAAPVYVLSAMNCVLNNPNIYDLLDKSNKEIARDIWLRLKQAGVQIKNPPILFSENGEGAQI